jgi:hypothetical protein
MSASHLQSLKIKAKLLQKAKRKAGKIMQLKEAFAILAKAAGFSSWQDLKATLDTNSVFCPPGHSAYWKTWYGTYEGALQHLSEHGGFLLPYRKDFFICDADYLRFLGVGAEDRDLERVGSNWAEPRDSEAFARLMKRLRKT